MLHSLLEKSFVAINLMSNCIKLRIVATQQIK